jgi:hypothetical protein
VARKHVWIGIAFAAWIVFITLQDLAVINLYTGVPQPAALTWFANLPLWVIFGVIPTLFIFLIVAVLVTEFEDHHAARLKLPQRKVRRNSRGGAASILGLVFGVVLFLLFIWLLSSAGVTLAGLIGGLQKFLSGL